MQSLERRIAALEQKIVPAEKFTLIRRIVWVGQQAAEIQQLRDEQGTSWIRQQRESEQDFVERVKVEAWRSEWGVMVLNGFVWKNNIFLEKEN